MAESHPFRQWLINRREGIRQRIVDAIRWAQYRSVLPFLRELGFDRISFSTRGAVVLGASLERCIRVIRRHTPIRGKSLLILGCGRGEEIHRWVREGPPASWPSTTSITTTRGPRSPIPTSESARPTSERSTLASSSTW